MKAKRKFSVKDIKKVKKKNGIIEVVKVDRRLSRENQETYINSFLKYLKRYRQKKDRFFYVNMEIENIIDDQGKKTKIRKNTSYLKPSEKLYKNSLNEMQGFIEMYLGEDSEEEKFTPTKKTKTNIELRNFIPNKKMKTKKK